MPNNCNPWNGDLSKMLDSYQRAEQIGQLLAKNAGVAGSLGKELGSAVGTVARLPFQAAYHGTAAVAKNPKLWAPVLGLGLGAGAIGTGVVGKKLMDTAGDITSKEAGVVDRAFSWMLGNGVPKAMQTVQKTVAPAVKAPKVLPGLGSGNTLRAARSGGSSLRGAVAPPVPKPITPPTPTVTTKPNVQYVTQKTAPGGNASAMSQKQVEQQRSSVAGPTNVTPDPFPNTDKSKGFLGGYGLPIAAGLGIGAAGVGIGGSMLAGGAIKQMGREGDINNQYKGYGAPISGSASPYGYVSGPAA